MRTQKGTRLGVILAVNLLLPSLVFAQNPTSEDYAARSRTLIEADLRKLPSAPNDFRIEFLGDPNAILDHARFHGGTPRPTAGRASLSGRVVTPAWQAASGVRLLLTSSTETGTPRSVVTSTAGEFQFPNLVTGDYELQIDGNSRSEPVTLEAGSTRILVSARSTESVITILGSPDNLRPRVMARVYQANKIRFFYQVDFHQEPPDLEAMDLTEINHDFDEFGSPSLPTEAESKQLKTDLTPLLTALMDVGKGPQRLKPLFSSKLVCRLYDSGEPVMPSRDNQSCALDLLDTIALAMWFQMEASDGEPPQIVTPFSEFSKITSDEERIALAARTLDIFRQELRRAGLFEPQHASRVQRYYVDLLSNLAITKLKSTGENQALPLPKGDLFMLGPLFLIREDAKLKIVGVFMAGG